jgi:hypothetical protein
MSSVCVIGCSHSESPSNLKYFCDACHQPGLTSYQQAKAEFDLLTNEQKVTFMESCYECDTPSQHGSNYCFIHEFCQRSGCINSNKPQEAEFFCALCVIEGAPADMGYDVVMTKNLKACISLQKALKSMEVIKTIIQNLPIED